MQNESVQTLPSRIRSILEWRPGWMIAVGWVTFAILVGVWAQRIHAVLGRGDDLQAQLVWSALLGDATTHRWIGSRCVVFINRDGPATRTLLPSCAAPRPGKPPS
jgi:hypothetical protein